MSRFLTPVNSPSQPSDIKGLRYVSAFTSIDPDLTNAALRYLTLKASRSRATFNSYNYALALLFSWLAKRDIVSIDEASLSAFQDALLTNPETFASSGITLSGNLSANSVRTYMSACLSFVTYLYTVGVIDYNTAQLVTVVGKKDLEFDVRKAFSDFQWQLVLDSFELMPANTQSQKNYRERIRHNVLFAYAMALRISEQSATQHGHMFKRDTRWRLDIQKAKGDRARRRSMNEVFDDIAIDTVTRYRAHLGLTEYPIRDCKLSCLSSSMPVYNNTMTKMPLGRLKPKTGTQARTWQAQFKNFLLTDVLTINYPENSAKQNLEIFNAEWAQLTPHSLRHTRITHLIKRGYDVFSVARFAGHQNVNTTQIYVDVDV